MGADTRGLQVRGLQGVYLANVDGGFSGQIVQSRITFDMGTLRSAPAHSWPDSLRV
jgi:hypothetical protein